VYRSHIEPATDCRPISVQPKVQREPKFGGRSQNRNQAEQGKKEAFESKPANVCGAQGEEENRVSLLRRAVVEPNRPSQGLGVPSRLGCLFAAQRHWSKSELTDSFK
jgi:hypothetical protein